MYLHPCLLEPNLLSSRAPFSKKRPSLDVRWIHLETFWNLQNLQIALDFKCWMEAVGVLMSSRYHLIVSPFYICSLPFQRYRNAVSTLPLKHSRSCDQQRLSSASNLRLTRILAISSREHILTTSKMCAAMKNWAPLSIQVAHSASPDCSLVQLHLALAGGISTQNLHQRQQQTALKLNWNNWNSKTLAHWIATGSSTCSFAFS